MKIEAELSSFITVVDQLFGEVEIRVNKKESSSQTSVAELRKFEEFLHRGLIKAKEKKPL